MAKAWGCYVIPRVCTQGTACAVLCSWVWISKHCAFDATLARPGIWKHLVVSVAIQGSHGPILMADACCLCAQDLDVVCNKNLDYLRYFDFVAPKTYPIGVSNGEYTHIRCTASCSMYFKSMPTCT